jgi:hypothetical protein
MDMDTTSMAPRIEVNKQLRIDHRAETKAEKSAIPNKVCAATDAARLTAPLTDLEDDLGQKCGALLDGRKHNPPRIPTNPRKRLIRDSGPIACFKKVPRVDLCEITRRKLRRMWVLRPGVID